MPDPTRPSLCNDVRECTAQDRMARLSCTHYRFYQGEHDGKYWDDCAHAMMTYDGPNLLCVISDNPLLFSEARLLEFIEAGIAESKNKE